MHNCTGDLMDSPTRPDANDHVFHVLLVGIDDYQAKPLRGCVNDIDAVQRMWLGPRVGVTRDRIRRLASPLPEAVHDTSVPAEPATLANLRAALVALGSEAVSPGDRVFIYYSGHGTRVAVTAGGQTLYREALVPVDADDDRDNPRLLFDFELNALLAAITARTRCVTLVLDCCHSAGATRTGLKTTGPIARYIDPPVPRTGHLPDPAGTARSVDGKPHALARGIDDCHVVSACQGHELAYEDRGPDDVRGGLLTRALVDALQAVPDVDLRAVSWGRIWQAMRAAVEQQNPRQHPWMAGNPGRAVLAGPPLGGDAGLPVMRRGDREYHIDAGTLAMVTPGAMLAVYGEQPPYFPRLDSEPDRAARVGCLLRVTSAERADATAEAVDAPFELPPGARGRLVRAGAPERLRCAIVPASNALAARLRTSPLLELVEPPHAQVRLELVHQRWLITDDVHGCAGDEPILFALHPRDVDCAHKLLEHYYRYALPLRMAALATDLSRSLELRVLVCPDRDITPAEAQVANFPEAPTRASATYNLRSGAKVCFRIHNTSGEHLRVTLVNSAASGKVQMLGDQVIDAHSFYVFWTESRLGAPFTMKLPPGSSRSTDRLTAIGRTAIARDVGYLRVDETFAEVVQRFRTAKDIEGDSPPPRSAPPETWTAAQVILDTRSHEVGGWAPEAARVVRRDGAKR
jgi:hypothetical protein